MKKHKKIKFLATGDLHSNLNLSKIIEMYGNIDDIDFVILVGDISEKKSDFSKLLKVFKGKEIFMVPGNHETKKKLDALQKNYNVHLIGNRPVKVHDDLAFFGTNYLSVGPYGVPEQDVFDNMIANYEAIKDTKFKIQLSHLPPSNTVLGDASPFFPFIGGSDALRVFLEHFKPDMTLVGHIHETSGLEEIVNKTKVINVGQTFKVFEFDPDKSELKVVEQKKREK